jgi:hypothetical protein
MTLLASIIAKQGRFGDTELAHVTPEEKALLESLGGAGTINPNTGLREYHGSNSYDYKLSNAELKDADFDSYHVHYGPNTIRTYDINKKRDADEDDDEYTTTYSQSINWDATQADTESYLEDEGTAGWGGYFDSDVSANEFGNMTDFERRQIASDIIKYEEGAEHSFDKLEYAKRMPKYDKKQEELYRSETSKDISKVGKAGQSSLLELNMANNSDARRGFVRTGNPMIDKQRQNLIAGMREDIDTRYETGQKDIEDHQEDYMEEWEEGLLSYISQI